MSPQMLGAYVALIHLVQTMADELDMLTGGNEWMETMGTDVRILLEESEFTGFSEGEEQGIREGAEQAIAMVLSGRPACEILSEMSRH
jgi:hypothetical protein